MKVAVLRLALRVIRWAKRAGGVDRGGRVKVAVLLLALGVVVGTALGLALIVGMG